MAIKIRQSGSWKEISGTLGNDTTYEYLLVDSGSSTGSGTGNDSILRLKPSEGDNDDIKLIAGDNVSFGLDTTAGTLQISSSASGTLADVKQYSDNADPRTERSCINPIEVSGNTIGIGTTSNAYGNKYIQSNDPTTVDGGSNTVCEGDLWYDTSVEGGGGSGGSSTFIGLTDTPTTYTGQQGKLVKVNSTATGLEFSSSGGGGDTYTLPLTGTNGSAFGTGDATWTLTASDGTNQPNMHVKAIAGPGIRIDAIDPSEPEVSFRISAQGGGSLDPVGTIVAWSGSVENIPTDEYQLCDGGAASTTALQDITGANVPDLRDKFIVGATDSTGDTTYPGLSPGATGGGADAVVVQHNHGITDTGHAHDIKYVNTHINAGHAEESGSGTPAGTNSTESAATGITIDNEGVVGTNKNLPPYYSLCYIIKHTAKIVASTSAITKIATVKDVKEYNESGGPCTAQSWNGRDLNTVNDPHSIGITSTTDGIISVPAGTYSFNWTAPAYYIALHNTRLEYSTNDDFPPTNTTTVNGSSAFSSADDPGDSNCQTDSTGMIGSVTFTQTTYVRLVHWTELSSTGSRQNLGLGVQSGYENAGNSVYAQIFIEDLSTAVKKGTTSGLITVKDYGAVGDGATDDTASIQAAINATSAAKQRLYIPAGTYIVSSLSLLDNTYLFGVGTLKRKASSTGYVIVSSTKNNCILKGFTIDGNKSAATDNKAAIHINGGYQIVIDGITVTNHIYDGISIFNTTDRTQKTESYIKNCTVSDSGRYGIEVQNVKDLTIIGNLISNLSGASNPIQNTGISIYGTAINMTDLITVEGNTVIDVGGAGISAPYISDTSNFGVSKVQIIDNKVKGSGYNGIVVQTNNGIVSNNICDDNGTATGHQGILINAHYITVDGNSSINNAGVGIDVGDGKFVTVTDNIVNNNAQIGIEINSCESCVVDGNIVRDNWTGDAGDTSLRAGIVVHEDTSQFSGGCSDITVSNNEVKTGTYQKYGISLLANTNRVSIIGNSLTGSGNNSITGSRALNIEAINGSFICEKNIDPPSDIASATSITVDQNTNFAIVTGTTTIESIFTDTGKYQRGRMLTILFTGALQVTNGSNLNLNGNLTTSNGTTLTLVAEDGYWYEVSRKSGSGGGSSAGDISFTQTGTGAVARTVDGKLKDNINVWDFIPVGTTTASTDCASYFQAAINTGKTVYVPKGTYRIDSTLLLDSGYETLIGDECMPVLLKWTEGPAIQISEPGGSDLNEYSRVENFYIQRQVGGLGSCPNYNETLTESLAGVVVSGHGAGVAGAVRSTRLSNLRVGNFAVGFYFTDCVGVTVHKCRAQNLTKDYEDATHTANGTPITSSMWGVGFYFEATRYGAGSLSPLASIEIVECDDNREGDPTTIKSVSYLVVGEDIRDIFFQRAESSHADYGYYIDGKSNDDLNWDVHIIRPIIDTFKKHAVYITNVDGVGSVSIIGGYYVAAKNTASLHPEAAIYATNSNGICITGGAQILGLANDTVNDTDEGIKLDSCSSCSIIGNRFANLQYGILLNGTTYSTIQGNVISAASSEDDASPTLHEAIRLEGNSTYNTVGNNTIRGLSGSNKYTKGIYLESGSDNCKLIGNIIDSTTVATQIDDSASGTDDGTPTVWHVEKTDAQEIHTNPVAWTDITGLSQTVTSASASTKFLINATVNASIMGTGSDGVVRLMRGNTVIGSTSSDSNAVSTKTGFGQVSGQNGQYQSNTLAITYLDTPGTGTHTYHIEGVNSDASIGMVINRRGLNLDFYVTSHMSIQQIS